MTDFFKHSINLAKHNIDHIKDGVETAIDHAQIGHGMDIHFGKRNHTKIMNAYNKGKNLMLKLTKKEMDHNIEHGTGFGNFMAKTFGVHNAVRKLKNTGKMLARDLAPQALGAIGTAVGSLVGNPELGIVGAEAGNVLSRSQALQNGKGLFRTLHKLGVSKKQVTRGLKNVAHQALAVGSNMLHDKLAGNAQAQNALSHVTNIAHSGLDGNLKQGIVNSAKELLPQAHDLIHQHVLQSTGSADLANNVADAAHGAVQNAIIQHGQGMKFHPKNFNHFAGKARHTFHKLVGGELVSTSPLGYSPIMDINSPAMNPGTTKSNSSYNNPFLVGGSFK